MFIAGLLLLGPLIVAVPPPSIVIRCFSLTIRIFSLHVPVTVIVSPGMALLIAACKRMAGTAHR